MKPKDKILTYAQAKELKWFGDNCLGLRQEYYELFGKVIEFGQKIERLSKQGLLIEDFLRRNPREVPIESDESFTNGQPVAGNPSDSECAGKRNP